MPKVRELHPDQPLKVVALGGGIVTLFLAHRYRPGQILKTLAASLSAKALLLVVGIMIFQEVLRATGALAGISAFFGMSNRIANVTNMRPNAEFYALGR